MAKECVCCCSQLVLPPAAREAFEAAKPKAQVLPGAVVVLPTLRKGRGWGCQKQGPCQRPASGLQDGGQVTVTGHRLPQVSVSVVLTLKGRAL